MGIVLIVDLALAGDVAGGVDKVSVAIRATQGAEAHHAPCWCVVDRLANSAEEIRVRSGGRRDRSELVDVAEPNVRPDRRGVDDLESVPGLGGESIGHEEQNAGKRMNLATRSPFCPC